MKVRYWWTEDGIGEICNREDGILEEATECYHCMSKLQKGMKVSKLTAINDGNEYVMCRECADRSTQMLASV